MKFNQDTQIMIDRTYIDFSNVEFGVLEVDEDVAKIKLTNKGLEEYKARIKARTHKHGTDEHLIGFMVDDLKGELWFQKDEEETSEVYSQIIGG